MGHSYWGFALPENYGDQMVPDITVVAKTLGNGMFPISAAIVRKEVADKFGKRMWFNT